MASPLVQASQFSSLSAPQLYNSSGSLIPTPAHPNDPVTLTLSSGVTVTVFDSLTTALKVLKYMYQQNQWLIQLPKVMVVSVCHHKLLLLESTLANQRLLQTFGAPLYEHGAVRFASRLSYESHDLQSALQSVGSLQMHALQDNVDLASVNAQVVDYNYQQNAAAGQGSLLVDPAPLHYYLS
jgi:hypothetical protein